MRSISLRPMSSLRRLILLVCLLVLFSGEQALAQRAGPGLFLGAGPCSDVTGQVTDQTYCMDYSSGALYVWDGAKWQPISGNGTTSFNGGTNLSLTNTSNGTAAQAYSLWSNGSGIAYAGIKGTGATTGASGLPANSAFFGGGGGSSGTYFGSDQSGAPLYFYADGLFSAGTMSLAEDASANFFWNPPANVQTSRNINGALDIIASNTSGGGGAQAGYFVQNASGIAGGFSALGTGWAPGGPYLPSEAYVNGDQGNGLLLYSATTLHLGSSSQPFTLDMTSDGSGDFNFASNATGSNQGIITFQTNSEVRALSENNGGGDIFEVLPQNLTQGIGMSFSLIHSIGSNPTVSMNIDAKGSGILSLNAGNAGGRVDVYASGLLIRGATQGAHLGAYWEGVSPTAVPSQCANGTVTAGSTDVSGEVTFSAAAGGNCLITFVSHWAALPWCVCSAVTTGNGAAVPCGTTTSTIQMNLWGQFLNTTAVRWHCIGQNT